MTGTRECGDCVCVKDDPSAIENWWANYKQQRILSGFSQEANVTQKWEYYWAVIPSSLGKIKVDGNKIQSHDYVNELGGEGWELVAIEQSLPGSGISDYILFFKRPQAG